MGFVHHALFSNPCLEKADEERQSDAVTPIKIL